jgi:hypothetical protein
MRPSKKHGIPATDVVYFTKPEKLSAVVTSVREAAGAGRSVLVLAHFRTTLLDIDEMLASAGILHKIEDHPLNPSYFQSESPGSESGEVVLSLSEHIGRYAPQPSRESRNDTLEMIVVEHYPIEERDNLILSLAQALGLERPVQFLSCLEDPLFREFGSDRYAEVLKALPLGPAGPMTGKPISRAIRAAQRKVRKRAVGDQYASSPEEWFTYNIRRGLNRKPAGP